MLSVLGFYVDFFLLKNAPIFPSQMSEITESTNSATCAEALGEGLQKFTHLIHWEEEIFCFLRTNSWLDEICL